MRLTRVLVTELRTGEVVLRGSEAHHLRDVLRLVPGAPVEAFDGRGSVAEGRVTAADKGGVVLELGEPRHSRAEPGLTVTVAVALLKGDKLAGVVRQCTELGADRFVLLQTRHADVTSLSVAKRQRLQHVAAEAARQSERARVPSIEGPVQLGRLEWEGVAIVADPRAPLALSAALGTPGARERLTLVTGPEGGLAASEVMELVDRGAVAASLGPRILRAETAPVALAAVALLREAGESAREVEAPEPGREDNAREPVREGEALESSR
ncbi:MAG: RsmE family RNA methyltransferase [Truepera sp.]|nr:RsmE family RNA methyltransferase [Truepera sp.]